jgi:hypothetical protein
MEDEFFMVNLNEADPLCSMGEKHFFCLSIPQNSFALADQVMEVIQFCM